MLNSYLGGAYENTAVFGEWIRNHGSKCVY